jgi:hypothetical protein
VIRSQQRSLDDGAGRKEKRKEEKHEGYMKGAKKEEFRVYSKVAYLVAVIVQVGVVCKDQHKCDETRMNLRWDAGLRCRGGWWINN